MRLWKSAVETLYNVVFPLDAKAGARRSWLTSSTDAAVSSSAASTAPLLRFPSAPSTSTSFVTATAEHKHLQTPHLDPHENPQAASQASFAPPKSADRSPPPASVYEEAPTQPDSPSLPPTSSIQVDISSPTGLGITLSSSSHISSIHLSTPTMAPADDLTRTASALTTLLRKPTATPNEINSALSSAKRMLLTHSLLLPNKAAPPPAHAAARYILETSSLLSIRAQDPDAFTRYVSALQPFYELPLSAYPKGEERGQKSKVTGLYLMLLLTKGDYAGFHTLLESLETEDGGRGGEEKEIKYPVMLERWLMEGSYDRVWQATKGDDLPSAEFGIFSQVLMRTIQEEIASCSERAYPSIPIANAKNLLFQDSEGAVVKFAQERGWQVKDGRIYFPEQGQDARNEKEILVSSGQVIENTIGYARELETIV